MTIVGVGLLMIFYVTVGGMKGTTWVQIIKAVLLMTGSALIVVLVLAEYGFNLSDLLGAAGANYADSANAAAREAGSPETATAAQFLEPGLKYGATWITKSDFLCLGPGAGPGHRWAAAHPDPLLHRPDRARGPASRCCGRSA